MNEEENFGYFKELKDSGINSKSAYKISKQLNMDPFLQIRMLRSVYELNLTEAKEITVTADSSVVDLNEHQQLLLKSLKSVFD